MTTAGFDKTFILSVLVNNNSGVLTRIAGLFARRGYNIRSLTVGETLDSTVSRMTIECIGDDYTVNQIQCQLKKVEDVITVSLLESDSSVCRELFLVRVKSVSEQISEDIKSFDCRILSAGKGETVLEVCGGNEDYERFLSVMKKYGEPDVSRTGITAIAI